MFLIRSCRRSHHMKQVPDSLLAFQHMFPDVVRRRRLTPGNRSESTCYHADRRPICALTNSAVPMARAGRMGKQRLRAHALGTRERDPGNRSASSALNPFGEWSSATGIASFPGYLYARWAMCSRKRVRLSALLQRVAHEQHLQSPFFLIVLVLNDRPRKTSSPRLSRAC